MDDSRMEFCNYPVTSGGLTTSICCGSSDCNQTLYWLVGLASHECWRVPSSTQAHTLNRLASQGRQLHLVLHMQTYRKWSHTKKTQICHRHTHTFSLSAPSCDPETTTKHPSPAQLIQNTPPIIMNSEAALQFTRKRELSGVCGCCIFCILAYSELYSVCV